MAATSNLSRLAAPAKAAITIGTLVLFGTGYYFLFHSDMDNNVQIAQQNGIKLATDLNAAREAEQAYQKDLAELAEREQRQKELNQILPASTEYPQFLSAVQSAANDSGVSLSAWTPRERVPEKYYARVPMKLELTGRFYQIARFFYNVGQLDRIINMEDISMTEPRVVDEEMVLRAEALATAFHVVDSPTEGGDAKGKGRRRGKGQ